MYWLNIVYIIDFLLYSLKNAIIMDLYNIYYCVKYGIE